MIQYPTGTGNGGVLTPAYERMLKHARECLLKRPPQEVEWAAGVEFDAEASVYRFKSLGQKMTISLPECEAVFPDTNRSPGWEWHLVTLHYLEMADGAPMSSELITFRMFPGGLSRGQNFDRECAGIIISEFCDKPKENFIKACEALGGSFRKSNADVCAVLPFLPRFPVTLQIWFADDELAGSGQLLLGGHSRRYLSTEDAVVAGSVVLEALIDSYKRLFPI